MKWLISFAALVIKKLWFWLTITWGTFRLVVHYRLSLSLTFGLAEK